MRALLRTILYNGLYKRKQGEAVYSLTKFIYIHSLYKMTKEEKVCKGCTKCVIHKDIKFSVYKDTLLNRSKMNKNMNLVKSKLHNVHPEQINKIVLSAFDNKRYLLNDGITSYAFNHSRSKNYVTVIYK